jgi:tetratricopeptide (TPR) repeat protein
VAISQYRDILRRDPSFWLARYNLGYAEYMQDDCEAAAHDLSLAARQNALDAETFFYLGDCRFRLGDHADGVALMRRGIELDPRLPNFRARLADDLASTGEDQNLREALELYRAEARANPAHPTAAARARELEARLATGR